MRRVAISTPRPIKPVAQLREVNRARLLRLVRTTGPLSRSQLTDRLGLNRSTVGSLVTELEHEGWLAQTKASVSGPGRPSPRVSVAADRFIVALNPEVDLLELALIRLDGRIVSRVALEMEPNTGPEEHLARAIRAVPSLQTSAIGVGIAVPGLVDSAGIVHNAPHLGWRGIALQALAEEAFGLPVRVANDAACGALAERSFGQASAGSLVFINGGSSGIGSALFERGERVMGSHGFAGEWGHTLLSATGERRSFEALVNKRRIEALAGAPLSALNAEAPELQAELDEQYTWLAVALGNLIAVHNPDEVVLSGYLAWLDQHRPGWLTEQVSSYALTHEQAFIHSATVDAALLVGAAELIAQELPALEQQ